MIPDQLQDHNLIRVCRPECRSHPSCEDEGKRPVHSVDDVQPLSKIRDWVGNGGNYGVPATTENSLVVLDVDSSRMGEWVQSNCPKTFVVESGGDGYGYHHYFRCPEWDGGNQPLGKDVGSLRSKNYHVVGPGSLHVSGNRYRIETDTTITRIDPPTLSDLLTEFTSAPRSEDGGGGGSSRRSLSTGTTAADLSVEPSQETLRALRFINHDRRRQEVAKVLDHSHPPRHIRVWCGAFLYGAVGLEEHQIVRVFSELANWASDRRRTETEIRSLVRSSIDGNQGSDEVDLDRYLTKTADMADDTAERLKMEESDKGRTLQGGEMMSDQDNAEYIDKESVVVFQGSSDGDSFRDVVLVERKENGDTTEYVALKEGQLQEVELADGQTALSKKVYGSQSLGNPEYIDDLVKALKELKEKIN